MGKTSFVVSLIRKLVVENQLPTAFFSLELTTEQLMMRILLQQTNITTEKLRLGTLNEIELQLVSKKIDEIKDSPLYISDYPFCSISAIKHELEFHPPNFVKIMVIDSLQLISKNKKDKVGKILNKKEIAKITFQLKEIAVKFNISIIVLFEVQENKRKYYNKMPNLSEIRKQAPLHTYADLVLLLYRPEYYKIDIWEDDETPTAGQAEIIIAKNSHGNLDNIRVKFDAQKGMFDNLPTTLE
jgi:replicative DNA helicase